MTRGVVLLALGACQCQPEDAVDRDPGGVCEPGDDEECECRPGLGGFRVCRGDGSGWEDCECHTVEGEGEPGVEGEGEGSAEGEGEGALEGEGEGPAEGEGEGPAEGEGEGEGSGEGEGEVCTPEPEVCDGADNDCDAAIDEDEGGARLSRACYGGPVGTEGVGGCSAGRETCAGGVWPGVCEGQTLPAVEVCNGEDDDCDGSVDEDDEGEPLARGCYTGPEGTQGVGSCHAGVETCDQGAWPGACEGEGLPGEEVCDGSDNDCDGVVDGDADGAPLARPCFTGPPDTEGVGPCHAGRESCAGGVWPGICDEETVPEPEVCNGADDDCDAQIDEDEDGAPLRRHCYTGPDGTEGVGACAAGAEVCQDGDFGACEGETTPAERERCGDDVDDDCDGETSCSAAGVVADGFPTIFEQGLGIRGVALGADGGGWVAGSLRQQHFNRWDDDLALLDFGPDGAARSPRPILRDGDAGGQGGDEGSDVAIDGEGNVWVAGRSAYASAPLVNDFDYAHALWKFDSAGVLAPGFPVFSCWGVDPGGACGSYSWGNDVAIGPDGAAWTTGMVYGEFGPGGGHKHFAVWRFEPDGALSRGFPVAQAGIAGGSRYDEGFGIAVDSEGHGWAVGASNSRVAENDTDSDLVLMGLVPTDGAVDVSTWVAHDVPGAGTADRGLDIALAPDGDLWVLGLLGSLAGAARPDGAVLRLSPDGALRPGFPVVLTDGQENGDPEPVAALAVDPDGLVWVAGNESPAPGEHACLVWKLAEDGQPLDGFPLRLPGPAGDEGPTGCRALAVAADGAVWLGGYAGGGTALWRLE